jgi:hypothetical protein
MNIHVTKHFTERLMERHGLTVSEDELREMKRQIIAQVYAEPFDAKEMYFGGMFDVRVRGVKFVAILRQKGLDQFCLATTKHPGKKPMARRVGHHKFKKKLLPNLTAR